MALFTLSVQCEGIGEYWTQVVAESHREALDHLLLGPTLAQFLLKHPEWPTPLLPQDVLLFTHMKPLKSIFLAQLGRDWKYVTVHVVETHVEGKFDNE
jgi:hypothetical protein